MFVVSVWCFGFGLDFDFDFDFDVTLFMIRRPSVVVIAASL